MSNNSTKKIVLNGLMIALVFLATFFLKSPLPITGGYFNVGDTVIIIAAVLMGGRTGLVAGALGSFLADVAGGYYIFAPLTLVVKGLEGYLVGVIAAKAGGREQAAARRIFAIVTGVLVMAAGYFFGEAFILGMFDSALGYSAAVKELPFNLLQGGISAVLGYILVRVIEKTNAGRYLQ